MTNERWLVGAAVLVVGLLLAGCASKTNASGQSQRASSTAGSTSSGSTAAPTTPADSGTVTSSSTASSTSASPSKPKTTLVPPDAQHPAAGACGRATGTTVVIDMNPDIPAPRCVIVSAGQHLQVVNSTNRYQQTGKVVMVTWARKAAQSVPVGAKYTYAEAFGQYLAPGVHFLRMSAYPGSTASIWLR
ncbi:MAG: hypothetical protein ACR2KJ_18760 [Jatrophihabitans sp.]